MAEFADLAWGTAEVRRHLDNVIETAAESLSPTVVLETFKGLIHARPDEKRKLENLFFETVRYTTMGESFLKDFKKWVLLFYTAISCTEKKKRTIFFKPVNQETFAHRCSLRTDNEFLSRFLKARKMNTNDAFELYENYYRFVRRNSQLYNDRYNVHNSEIRQAIEDGLPGVLQRRDSRGRRVMVLFAAQWDPNRYSLSAVQKAFFISLDLLLRDCGVQEKGIVLIIDWSQFSLGQCRKLQLTVLKSIIEGLEYCYPVRFKSIHCVGQPWYVDAALSLLKPFLRETSRARQGSLSEGLVDQEIMSVRLGFPIIRLKFLAKGLMRSSLFRIYLSKPSLRGQEDTNPSVGIIRSLCRHALLSPSLMPAPHLYRE